MKYEEIRVEIKELEAKVEELQKLIKITQENIKNNFEDPNYQLVADSLQLRKLNKKYKKYQAKLNLLKEFLAALEQDDKQEIEK